jgi:FkbM family methyltransferase
MLVAMDTSRVFLSGGTMIILRIKSALVGSPLDSFAQQLKRLTEFPRRHRHPELTEIYLEEQRLPAVLKRLLKPNSNAVDVGCHIGSVLCLLRTIAPEGKHVAIEASKIKGEWLKKKFPTVDVYNVAVADRSGRAPFEENICQPGYSKLLGDNQKTENNYYDVEVSRLDDILTNRVDFIKLDIEGGELAALKGAIATLDKWHPSLLFECGSEYVPNKPSRRELFDFLTQRGYSIFCFADFLFDKGPMEFEEFRRCGLYPFRAFNFVAVHQMHIRSEPSPNAKT